MRKNKHEEAERYLNLAQQMKNVESGKKSSELLKRSTPFLDFCTD